MIPNHQHLSSNFMLLSYGLPKAATFGPHCVRISILDKLLTLNYLVNLVDVVQMSRVKRYISCSIYYTIFSQYIVALYLNAIIIS